MSVKFSNRLRNMSLHIVGILIKVLSPGCVFFFFLCHLLLERNPINECVNMDYGLHTGVLFSLSYDKQRL